MSNEMQQISLERIRAIMHTLRVATRSMIPPASQQIVSEFGRDPFLILVGCLLSLRTKDSVSFPASRRLFAYARTPQEMVALPSSIIEDLVYPVGFYKRKSSLLGHVSETLIRQFGGSVPFTRGELLSIKGIGPKTANLVLAEGFGIPALCVDTHVHRISNRLGLVNTRTSPETERELKQLLPEEYWIEWNRLLVMWGQNVCVPLSPFCSRCAIVPWCERVGVTKSR